MDTNGSRLCGFHPGLSYSKYFLRAFVSPEARPRRGNAKSGRSQPCTENNGKDDAQKQREGKARGRMRESWWHSDRSVSLPKVPRFALPTKAWISALP